MVPLGDDGNAWTLPAVLRELSKDVLAKKLRSTHMTESLAAEVEVSIDARVPRAARRRVVRKRPYSAAGDFTPVRLGCSKGDGSRPVWLQVDTDWRQVLAPRWSKTRDRRSR